MQRASKRKPGPRPPCGDTACEEPYEEYLAAPTTQDVDVQDVDEQDVDEVQSSRAAVDNNQILSARGRSKKRKTKPTRRTMSADSLDTNYEWEIDPSRWESPLLPSFNSFASMPSPFRRAPATITSGALRTEGQVNPSVVSNNAQRRPIPATITSGALLADNQAEDLRAVPAHHVAPATHRTVRDFVPQFQPPPVFPVPSVYVDRTARKRKTHRHRSLGPYQYGGPLPTPSVQPVPQRQHTGLLPTGTYQLPYGPSTAPPDYHRPSGHIQHQRPQTDSESESEEEYSDSDDDLTYMNPAQPYRQHTNTLCGGNAVPFQEPVSAPLPSQIPPKIRRKIWKHRSVDLAQLLPSDPLAGPHRGGFRFDLDRSGAIAIVPNQRQRTISSVEAWTTAFLRFVAIYAERYPFETPALMKYAEIVRDLARKRPGPAFLVYDAQFRGLRETVQIPWDRIHMESWLTATLQSFPWLEQQFFRVNRSRQSQRRPRSKQSPRYHLNTCWSFNKGTECRNQPCHPHVCGFCKGPHSAQACTFSSKQPSANNNYTPSRSQPSTQSNHKPSRK